MDADRGLTTPATQANTQHQHPTKIMNNFGLLALHQEIALEPRRGYVISHETDSADDVGPGRLHKLRPTRHHSS